MGRERAANRQRHRLAHDCRLLPQKEAAKLKLAVVVRSLADRGGGRRSVMRECGGDCQCSILVAFLRVQQPGILELTLGTLWWRAWCVHRWLSSLGCAREVRCRNSGIWKFGNRKAFSL